MSKSHSHNSSHFTGPRKGKPVRRKSRKQGKNVHVNKYASFSQTPDPVSLKKDKRLRMLPVSGTPGEIIPKGFRVTFHNRVYELINEVKIPADAKIQFYGYFRKVS